MMNTTSASHKALAGDKLSGTPSTLGLLEIGPCKHRNDWWQILNILNLVFHTFQAVIHSKQVDPKHPDLPALFRNSLN